MDLSGYRLLHADSRAELASAAELRERVYRERRQIGFDEALESRRDRAGHVFLLFHREALVATGRALPYPSRLSTLVDLSRHSASVGADSEIGRVACIACSEAPARALTLLTLGSLWLERHTRLRRYVAYCQPSLVRVYRRVGASAGESVHVLGDLSARRVVSGSYDAAARLGMRALGIDEAGAGALIRGADSRVSFPNLAQRSA